MNIEISTVTTLLVALFIVFAGYYLNSKIAFLKNNNIPEPVVGGIASSVIAAALHAYFDINFEFDMVFKTPLMTVFFTTVGLGASISLLVKGGPKGALFLGVATL
jgi:ESS family glutamate:Na+ symporter